MQIHIESPGVKISEEQREQMESILKRRYSQYEFMKRVDVKVVNEVPSQLDLSLMTHLEKADPQFVEFSHSNVINALNGAIKKMNGIIEKYKSKHYRSSRRADKSARIEGEI